MKKPPKKDFLKALEDGVRSVLENPDATPQEKIKAIQAGANIIKADTAASKGKADGVGKFFRE